MRLSQYPATPFEVQTDANATAAAKRLSKAAFSKRLYDTEVHKNNANQTS